MDSRKSAEIAAEAAKTLEVALQKNSLLSYRYGPTLQQAQLLSRGRR
jgi:hypothetical protein